MMHDIAQVCAVIAGVAGVLKLAVRELKLHLREDFATKHDLKRIEHKLDYMMGRRPAIRHAREDRVENG